jgi:hypothetical protein
MTWRTFLDARHHDQAFNVLNQIPGSDQDDRYALLGHCQEDWLSRWRRTSWRAGFVLEPLNALALNLKGILAYRKGDKGSEEFQTAAAADPGFGEPHTNLGVIRREEIARKPSIRWRVASSHGAISSKCTMRP